MESATVAERTGPTMPRRRLNLRTKFQVGLDVRSVITDQTKGLILSVRNDLPYDTEVDVEGVRRAFAEVGLGHIPLIFLQGLDVIEPKEPLPSSQK